MITYIENENFGYDVACDGNWAAVGNPDFLLYNPASASFLKTGSVEVYRYKINDDTHIKKAILHRPLTSTEFLYVTTEASNTPPTGPEYILHTEDTGSVVFTADLDLIIDEGSYFTPYEDGYGYSIDIYNAVLAVGDPYFKSNITVGSSSYDWSGSGSVDIFDLTKLDIDPYISRSDVIITSSSLDGGFYNFTVYVPSGQGFGYATIEYSATISGTYQRANYVPVSNVGGYVTIPTTLTTIDPPYVRANGIINTNPYLTSITNPNPATTSSFGHHVCLNSEWLAISSIHESGSRGVVYMYQKLNNNDASWSLYQTIQPPVEIVSGDMFGHSADINKHSGSYSGSLVIGSFKPSGSRAYIYNFESGSWTQKFTLYPDNNTIYPFTFFNGVPILSGSYPNTADSFGHSVAIFKNTVLVGAPTDRYFYEYSGSSVYQQGAAYFFEKCSDVGDRYYLNKKSYGNEKTLKNNLFGFSVSVYDDYAIVGSPKVDLFTTDWSPVNTICYLRGSIYQKHFCSDDSNDQVNGQFTLYKQITGSFDLPTDVNWDVVNTYQIKKRMFHPYRTFGYSVDICSDFISVGSPMFISGSNRIMDFSPDTGSFTGELTDIDELCGKSYIYNLNNLREEFYVGNAFYRNGKLVVMSSGSSFDGLAMPNILENEEYEYQVDFKSKQMIYEKQIVCPVEIGEFNVSTNPTAVLYPSSSYDLNQNGKFDFQDVDILLRYMKYKNTENDSVISTDWSSSILNTTTDEDVTVYNAYSSSWHGTDALFSQSFSNINNVLFSELDLNDDNKINEDDMNILWKYFTYRLTQKNYESYLSSNSQKKYLSDIIDFLNNKTMRGKPPLIRSEFADYAGLSKADPTGSYLTPYVTTIGLYNGTDLVAVAKLGSPIKITSDLPINFIVKMDF